MARYGDLDYGRLTKGGFGFGVGLFALGVLGLFLAQPLVGPFPGWEEQLLIDSEALGIAVAFLSVLLFGIVLPLTE